MSFDNTKNHVEINGVPYQISGYTKSEQSTFIPRLSAGDQKESEFNLLRSDTLDGFGGGSLQRFWEDQTSVFQAKSLFPLFDDGVLYPVADFTEAKELLSTTKMKVTAVLSMLGGVWIAYKLYNSTNALKFIDTAGSITTVTLPANISSADRAIISIVRSDSTTIYITCDDGLTMGYLSSGSDTSVAEIGTGTSTACVAQSVLFRGQLYGLDDSRGVESNTYLYRHTGGTSSRARVLVGKTEGRFHDTDAKMLVYNNRIMIMRNNGMWAYDGVQVVPIESTGVVRDGLNYRFPVVHRGYLYYFMSDGWYRFNGSLIEKVYDISEIGYPTAVTVAANRVWLAFSNSSAVASSRYDKAVGYDYSTGDVVNARLMCFDGKGMFEYARTANWTQASPDFVGQGEVSDIFWFNKKIYLFSNYDKIGTGGSGTNRYYTIPTNELAVNSGNKSWELITSIFDGDFPQIDKSIENLELVLDGNVVSDQTITVSYRIGGFDGSTAFTTLGTFSTQTELKRFVWKTIAAGVSFKQIQFKLVGTTDVRYGLRKLVLRYLLKPDVKWQWSFVAECYGDKPLEPLLLADDTEGTQAVSLLRNNIYAARQSDVPVKFLDVDQLDLNEDLDNSETTVTLNSTALLKDSGFVQIDDEIIYYSGKTSTDLTGCVRGVLGSSAATHDNGDKVFPVYRVDVEFQNERIELTEPATDATEDKSRASQVTVLLKEV